MKTVNMKVSDLIPYERNTKKHDETQIKNVAESIRQYGFVQPVVIDKDNVIVIGHCRVLGAKRLGMKEVPCVLVDDLTPEQVNALRIVDNKSNESEWDMDFLAEELPEIDLSMFDFDFGLEDEDEETEVVEDEAPEVDEESEPTAKLGDIWQLGRHRLMCGDSTDPDMVAQLMNGEKADLFLTDPPYNIALGMDETPEQAKKRNRRTDGLTVKNDKMNDEEFFEFLVLCFQNAKSNLKAGGVFYIWHADNEGLSFRRACDKIGWKVRECLVWVKSALSMGRQDYQWQHEPCLYGWSDGAGHCWYSDRKQSTVLRFDKPQKSKLHPTMKPVALFDYQIKNSTKQDDCVLDLFGGSGTTIMACEQNNRSCRTMEFDPKYVDVIIKRWEGFTGEKAVLLNEGHE